MAICFRADCTWASNDNLLIQMGFIRGKSDVNPKKQAKFPFFWTRDGSLGESRVGTLGRARLVFGRWARHSFPAWEKYFRSTSTHRAAALPSQNFGIRPAFGLLFIRFHANRT